MAPSAGARTLLQNRSRRESMVKCLKKMDQFLQKRLPLEFCIHHRLSVVNMAMYSMAIFFVRHTECTACTGELLSWQMHYCLN